MGPCQHSSTFSNMAENDGSTVLARLYIKVLPVPCEDVDLLVPQSTGASIYEDATPVAITMET
jgi:hypothetical protein